MLSYYYALQAFRVLFVLYWTLKTRYPRFNFRSSILISMYYMWTSVGTRASTSLSVAEPWVCSFKGPSLNDVTGKDSTDCYSSNSDSGGGGQTSKLWLKFPQHASLWIEYTWCHWPSLPRGAVCVEVFLNPGSMRTMTQLCSLISVYLYCEPISESRCSSKDTKSTVFFGVSIRKEPNIL